MRSFPLQTSNAKNPMKRANRSFISATPRVTPHFQSSLLNAASTSTKRGQTAPEKPSLLCLASWKVTWPVSSPASSAWGSFCLSRVFHKSQHSLFSQSGPLGRWMTDKRSTLYNRYYLTTVVSKYLLWCKVYLFNKSLIMFEQSVTRFFFPTVSTKGTPGYRN